MFKSFAGAATAALLCLRSTLAVAQTTTDLPSVKATLQTGAALVVELQVPPTGDENLRFLREVGGAVSFTIAAYDPEGGRGEASSSFGYGKIAVTATDTGLQLAITSPMGCSGSFKLADNRFLHGNLTCRWGNPFPSYYGTIDLGLK